MAAYEVLGLNLRTATADTIRKRQRVLAKTKHPDVAKGAPGSLDMQRINAAAEIAIKWVLDHPEGV